VQWSICAYETSPNGWSFFQVLDLLNRGESRRFFPSPWWRWAASRMRIWRVKKATWIGCCLGSVLDYVGLSVSPFFTLRYVELWWNVETFPKKASKILQEYYEKIHPWILQARYMKIWCDLVRVWAVTSTHQQGNFNMFAPMIAMDDWVTECNSVVYCTRARPQRCKSSARLLRLALLHPGVRITWNSRREGQRLMRP